MSVTLFRGRSVTKSCPARPTPRTAARQAPLSQDGHSSCLPARADVCLKLPRVVEYLILDLHLLFLTVSLCPPLSVETLEITSYFLFVNCLDVLRFYLYTPITLPGRVSLPILTGT